MNKDIFNDLSKLVIDFDSEHIPPPYAHRYTLTLSFDKAKPHADFVLEYYDRHEISEEEILEEGFNLNDDFKWNGSLSEIWNQTIKEKLRSVNWRDKKTENSHPNLSISVFIQNQDDPMTLFPDQSWIVENFLQEIIQAILEAGKKEKPLKVKYLDIATNPDLTKEISLTYYFSLLEIRLETSINNKKTTSGSLDWNKGHKLMEKIYAPDIPLEVFYTKKPRKPGSYIDLGDDVWYDLNKSTTRSTNIEKKTLKILKEQFHKLFD